MNDRTLERIDAAIADLQNCEPEKAPLVEPIIERLIAARQGLCGDPATCRACPVSCGERARWLEEQRAT